jgi:hypothetical protein
MRLQLKSLAGVIALVVSTTSAAQGVTQKPVTGADRKKTTAAPTVAPQTPAQTQTTTTQSTTSTNAVPDETGNPVAVQKTTDTTQTTTTQPPNSSAPAESSTSQTTSTTTVAPDETGAPTATTTTTTTQPAKDQSGATVTAATTADVKAGVPVFDAKGGVVGKIDSVSAKGAVVNTGTVKATVPVASFAKNDKGLVISMSKAEIDAAAKPAAATTTTTKTTKTTKKPK